ncbi:hypothetical protein T4D_2212 [Trichinella pseudospiralis]|uniref:Uncharacterized protein n=1 Tax=Trichinella pseudospiralis TaxID=6337 RepID=A0A0V1G360_TRIPS|nr:hypothetical protein T4D_2212 [Trichinella pseudospiralis]
MDSSSCLEDEYFNKCVWTVFSLSFFVVELGRRLMMTFVASVAD